MVIEYKIRIKQFYLILSKAFSSFLNVEVNWGHRKETVPIYKLIFGNFSRMKYLSEDLKENKQLKASCAQLEKKAASIIDELLSAIEGGQKLLQH